MMGDNRQQRGGNAFQRDHDGENRMLARVDTGALGAMPATADMPRTNFLPATFGEAMELAKLMAAGTFVPARLRGRAGDTLAVVMLATRLKMDPFVVAQKVYFVNDQGIPGYEAQLVAAIVNTSGVLDGKLDITWEGEGETLVCYVEGKLKGDPRPKKLKQAIKTITTRNSPLWKQAPMVQLGYHTQRSWARLFAPEALLGVYAADELVENGEVARDAGDVPARPTRRAIAERTVDNGEVVNTETGEVVDDEETARRLDAEDDARQLHPDDEKPPVDDAAGAVHEEQVSGAAADSQSAGSSPSTASQPGREDVDAAHETPAGDKQAPGPNAIGEKINRIVEASREPEPTIDWESWLGKLDADLGMLESVGEVDKLFESKGERLAAAPDGVKNRARGYVAARKRAIEKTAGEQKPAAAKRATRGAAAVDAVAEQAKPAEPVTDQPAPSPNEQLADQIIAEFNSKALLVDLRAAKTRRDAEIDALDDDNAGRVNRAFRALEDKLRNKSAA